MRLSPELYACSNRVYFFTVHGYGDRPHFVRPEINRSVIESLREQSARAGCVVFTFCLMPDHLHFLASPKADGVSVLPFVDRFKGRSTNASWGIGWHGKLWQPRYYDHVVRTEENLRDIAQYILDNPVRKGLAAAAEDWPWSGHMNPLPIE